MALKKLTLFLFTFSLLVWGQAQNLTIDEAITESVKNLSGKINAGTKVVVLNIESESKNLPDYIIDEASMQIMKNRKLQLVDKSNLSSILHDRNIRNLNEIDERTALEIGKMLGASVVISGSISKLGGVYKFRTQAVNSADGQIIGVLSLNVKEDELLSDLLKGDATPDTVIVQRNPPIRQETEFNDLSNVRQSGGLGDAQNARARLESMSAVKDTQIIVMKDTVFLVREAAPTAAAPKVAAVSAPVKKQEGRKLTWLGLNYQKYQSSFPTLDIREYYDNKYYDYTVQGENLAASSLNLEAGFMKERSAFTFLGLLDIGRISDAFRGLSLKEADNGVFGGGIYLGRTMRKYPVANYFRFSGGWDFGYWLLNFAGEDYWEGIQRSALLFGGPHLKFLGGYKKYFVSASFKTYFGYREDFIPGDYESTRRLGEFYYPYSFVAVYNWNIGLTFLF